MDRLEVPVPVPVSIGSRPSPQTMASEAPDIVSIDASGSVVGHRNGRAVIRTLHGEGSALVVTVRAAGAIELHPRVLRMRPGSAGSVTLRDTGSGREIPAGDATWGSTDPRVVTVAAGVARGAAGGRAEVVARYGGLEARAEVTVEAAGSAALRVVPERRRMKVGSVVVFDVVAAGRSVPATWRSSNPAVVEKLQGSLFQAKAGGRAQVCGAAAQGEACTSVEVVR